MQRRRVVLAIAAVLVVAAGLAWWQQSRLIGLGLRWYLTQLPVMMEYPLDTRVCGVAQPVLVLRGGRDPIARRPWCEFLARRAPRGTFVEVPGFGHVVQDSAPAAVAQSIVHWATAADGITA